LDETQARELVERLRSQEWDQGSLLDQRIDLFIANLRHPATAEGRRAAERGNDAPTAVVFEMTSKGPGMVVVSQRCDIVANPTVEPLCEAVPLVVWPEGAQLPRPNSSRYFLIDRATRLVADQTRRVSFEKSLLPDRNAPNLFKEDALLRSFRAWCARRYSRLAFPDDFVLTVGRALDRAIAHLNEDRDEAQAVHSWRVLLEEVEGTVEIAFLIPYDEHCSNDVKAYVDQVVTKAKEFLPAEHQRAAAKYGRAVREFRIVGHIALPLNEVRMRDILESEAMSFDDLTYTGETVQGLEPHEEHLY
jgi:hypothetical protein